MSSTLEAIVSDFASAIQSVDRSSDLPVASSLRSKLQFRPGIGPHQEHKAVGMIIKELRTLNAREYGTARSARYPSRRETCDLCIGRSDHFEWAIEIKLLRMKGDNGKPNDNMVTHILSPYYISRSAL